MIKTGVGKSNNPDAAKAGAEAAKEALTEAGGKTKEIELQRERELQEMDRIAKMLARRDLELSEIREKMEKEFQELEKRTRELEESRKALMNMLEDVEISRKALMNMLEDVEEAREKAEEEKNKTIVVINSLADGLLVFDKEGEPSLINPQAEDFFKVKSKEVIGKSILELTEIPNLLPLVELLGREIKGIFRKEIQVRENLVLEVSTISIMKAEEKLGTLVTLHDITREKTIERIKTEFVSLAAHQLRTPLSAIKWTLKMLLDGDLGEITKEQRGFLEKTYQSNERMISLINDLLNITRIEEGKYLYKPTLADFESIVYFVINSFQEEIARKKIVLDFQKPETKLPGITIDIEKMRLAVQNLLDNAVRYTPPRGRITILLEIIKFHDRDEKDIIFSIKDTGVGIPKDQQPRVFTKFFRGANVMRMDTEGTGLGLFIAKNIIEAHGGKIWFESEERKGTVFYFSLPVKELKEEL
jgi:PAS domain S-box-containing protein